MTVQFRPEVYKKRKHSLWGKVLLKPSKFYSKCTQVIVGTTFLFSLLLVFGHYTTKETVQGLIEPRKGLISIYAPNHATVEEIYVTQGDIVQANQPLLKLDFHENLSDGQRYDDRLAQEIESDRQRLEQQIQFLSADLEVKKEEILHQSRQAQSQLDSLKKQYPLEEQTHATLQSQYQRLKKAFDQGSIAQIQLEQIERELANSAKNKIRLEHDIQNLQLQLEQIPFLLKQIENQYIEKCMLIQQQIAQLSKNYLELERRTRSVISSPVDGVVTQMDLQVGQTIRGSEHLVDLKKQGDLYWAKIYVPSQSIGFVKKGQSVSLRIQAFPHQHYGSLDGTVELITDSIYQGAGNTSGKTFYIVYVELAQQSMASDGRFPLKQGMQIDADIKTQEMTFVQKIFEPLYRLKR